MPLYLIRHGSAVAKDVDETRPLSDTGKHEVRAIASFLEDHSFVTIDEIRVSSKLRARQTAEILAETVSFNSEITEVPYLEPDSPADDAISAFPSDSHHIALIGHLPHLERLASLLVAGNVNAGVFSGWPPATALCLAHVDKGGTSGWGVRWMIDPTMLGAAT